jgi:DNA processing protein
MLDLPTSVALSLVSGRTRCVLVERLRDQRPDLLSPGHDSPCPPLDALIATLQPECPDPAGLAATLRRRAALALAHCEPRLAVPLRLGDPRYPRLLAAIPDPPLVLWVGGSLAGLDGPSVAIVGARAASATSLEIARRLGRDLAAAGLAVVSGLARGIDAAAHGGALEAGRTVAVLGSGVDVIYPPEHRHLAERVSAAGALVSELPPGTPPRAHHFPMRNRIISGLSLAVVVVEAAARSGSLITARCGLDQGREVMAVPGSALGGRNRGAHALIRDGARLVESAEDVLDELGLASIVRPEAVDACPPDPLLAAMPVGEPMELESLAGLFGVATAALLGRLAALEVSGHVARAPGGRFVRLGR